MHADLALINGNFITMNPSRPQAQAVAIKNQKIIKAGNNSEIKSLIKGDTEVIDLKGRTVLPGFIDTHIHMAGFGKTLAQINLRGVQSITELQKNLEKRVEKTEEERWILGRGWDQDRLKEKQYPTRWDLDKASPNNPVLFTRVCGHLSVANSKALEKASITKETISPPGGRIDKDSKTGEPTGILRENARDLVHSIIPKPSKHQLMKACGLACQKAVEAGLTSVHWIIHSSDEIQVIQNLRAKGKLLLRVYMLIPIDLLDHLIHVSLFTGFGDHTVRIGGVKLFADGSLGARTAALNRAYSDDPSTRGMMIHNEKKMQELVTKAHGGGLQLAVHAIGDRALDIVLTTVEKALQKRPRKDFRHRIEHASVLNKALITRMRRLGIMASVQPHFIISDFWVADRLGPRRARWTYPFKSLIQEGIRVAGGSDCPVEPVSPLLGIWAAVSRRMFPEENITVDEALRLYTIDAAAASFEEEIKGSIEIDKLADLVVLSHDPRVVPTDGVKEISVEMTFVGGNMVYASGEAEIKAGP
ncbi:MAG: amidohydrolase [Candidatus Bathyarchaeota archaeon]|nr:MAG: amidohydrolase [Candidatus Bathyarchaeota archaeon]